MIIDMPGIYVAAGTAADDVEPMDLRLSIVDGTTAHLDESRTESRTESRNAMDEGISTH